MHSASHKPWFRKADPWLLAVVVLYCAVDAYFILHAAEGPGRPSRDAVGFFLGSGPVLAFSLIVVACDFKCFSKIVVLICCLAFLALSVFAFSTFQTAATVM